MFMLVRRCLVIMSNSCLCKSHEHGSGVCSWDLQYLARTCDIPGRPFLPAKHHRAGGVTKIDIDSLAHGVGTESNVGNVRNLFTDAILLLVMISSDDLK